jgi:sec-independent protein translocase protein TatB|tara:strand:- start:128 stop:361 length:234 start_codon:yes stop_codon:yes gene_type:complete
MPQIGWLELLIIVVIAILVIGPKDFPIVLRKLGTWSKTVKKYFSDVQSNINDITNLDVNLEKNPIEKNKKNNNDKKK